MIVLHKNTVNSEIENFFTVLKINYQRLKIVISTDECWR